VFKAKTTTFAALPQVPQMTLCKLLGNSSCLPGERQLRELPWGEERGQPHIGPAAWGRGSPTSGRLGKERSKGSTR